MLPVGLYLMGDAPEAVESQHGNYRRWFAALAEANGARLVVADGRAGEGLDLTEVAAVVISGSPDSLTEPQPWMDGGFELIDSCSDRGRPVLGVCFGHQLLGAYAGATVIRNPRGWEFGTYAVSLNATATGDPLFAGCPALFEANQAHQDILEAAPPGSRVLASSTRAAVQALAIGDWGRGVQFHPEFTGPVTAAYLRVRRELLEADAADHGSERHPDRLAARDCPQAEQVFGNFIDHFARRA